MHNLQNLRALQSLVGCRAAGSLAEKYESLNALARADVDELRGLPGIGMAKALQVKAALELSSLLSHELLTESPILDNPERVVELLKEETRTYRTEEFQVLLLNTRKRLIRIAHIASGTLDTVLVHSREVFRAAIAANAAGICLVHNHPSGDATPSPADINTTRDLIRAGQLLKIEVVDHVIIGQATEQHPKAYSSLRELGYFYA